MQMLEMPSYIRDSGIVGAPITYKWKPYLHIALADKAPRNLMKAVEELSCNATKCVAIGVAEMMWWRLKGLGDRRETILYIEALWAWAVDVRYLKKDAPDQEGIDRSNPSDGALGGTEVKLFSATMDASLDDPERGKSFAGLVAVVRHTMPDSKFFESWLKQTLQRFTKAFPYDSDDPYGLVVPRRFLDPGVPINKKAIPDLLDEQLRSIDHDDNPFLRTPTELKAAGFEGTPYRYKA
jgi:hypothetical protein